MDIYTEYVKVLSKLSNKKATQGKNGQIFEETLHQQRYMNGK